MATLVTSATRPQPARHWRYGAALLGGNIALVMGSWAVRLADCGPLASGFWRLLIALPLLLALALITGERPLTLPRRLWVPLLLAGALFAADLAFWHIGILRTRLTNATLFGNASSLMLMVWALMTARRWPRRRETAALVAALAGAAILLGRSLQLSAVTLWGDLACVAAAFFYLLYLLLLRDARADVGAWTALTVASGAGAPLLLAVSVLMGERVWPGAPHGFMRGGWLPLVALALGSQVLGQGLLVYALRHFSTLVIGFAMLTQPVMAVVVGWALFGEVLTPWDGMGAALVAGALVLSRVGEG